MAHNWLRNEPCLLRVNGEFVPLHEVARFAKRWYGSHADPDWHKWTVAKAQDIFHQAGLRSDFWDLAAKGGRF